MEESSEEFEKPKVQARVRSTQNNLRKPSRTPHHLPRNSLNDSLVSQFDWKILEKLYFSPVPLETIQSVWWSIDQIPLQGNPKSGAGTEDRNNTVSKVLQQNGNQDSVIVLFVTRTVDSNSKELLIRGTLVTFQFTEYRSQMVPETSQTSNFRIIPFYKRRELEEELEDIRMNRMKIPKFCDAVKYCPSTEARRVMEIESIKELDSEMTAELIQKQIFFGIKRDTAQPESKEWQEGFDGYPITAEVEFLENERLKVRAQLEVQKQVLGIQLVRNEM